MSTPHAAPRRGSPDYYARIFQTAEADTLDETTSRLRVLWMDYGWRSTIDVMTEWICAIDYIVPTAKEAGYRDFTGTVITDRWAPEEFLSEERMLAMAIRAAADREESDGLSPHDSFSRASILTERLRENVLAWKPHFTDALRTAHTTSSRDAVRALLTRGPGVKERDWWALRDGAAYLRQTADWPLKAARQLGLPVRPPEVTWAAGGLPAAPALLTSLLSQGEITHDR